MIGTRIGRWLITEEIGDGGHAFVFKGVCDGDVSAIKMLKPSIASEENLEKRFKLEVEALKQLQHPGIVDFKEYIHAGGYHYLVLEFMDEGAVDHLLRNCGPLEPRYAVPIFWMVLEGMKYAHEYGYVHRDIKPNNILINKQGHAKITDFGIAKVTGGEELTRQGYVLGTSLYMAPEYLSQGKVTPQTDIYSLGVLLYEMLTNRKPFEFQSDDEPLVAFAKRVLMGSPTPPTAYRPIPPELEKIILRSLARDPKKRYKKVQQFQTDLRKAFPDLVERPIEIPEGRPRTGMVKLPENLAVPPQSSTALRTRFDPWIVLVVGLAVGAIAGALTHLAFSLEVALASLVGLLATAAVLVGAYLIEKRRTQEIVAPAAAPSAAALPADDPSSVSVAEEASDRMPYHAGVGPQGTFEETEASELAAFLTVTSGESKGKRYGLRPISRIGRDLRFDIRPPDPEISRHHAVITFTGKTFVVKDTGSTNGTFVNEVQVKPNTEADLEHSNILRVGRTSMRFDYSK